MQKQRNRLERLERSRSGRGRWLMPFAALYGKKGRWRWENADDPPRTLADFYKDMEEERNAKAT